MASAKPKEEDGYFVYWSGGSCQRGDCDYGLEHCPDWKAAEALKDEIVRRTYGDAFVTIIRGGSIACEVDRQ